jgi:hypothetical protein
MDYKIMVVKFFLEIKNHLISLLIIVWFLDMKKIKLFFAKNADIAVVLLVP